MELRNTNNELREKIGKLREELEEQKKEFNEQLAASNRRTDAVVDAATIRLREELTTQFSLMFSEMERKLKQE